MRPLSLVLAFLLLPTLAIAQPQQDVDVRVESVARAGIGARVEWRVIVRNHGPLRTFDVRSEVGSSGVSCSRFGTIDPGDEMVFVCSGVAPSEPQRLRITATVRRTTDDPNPVIASASLDVVRAPDLMINFFGPLAVARGSRVPYGLIMDRGDVEWSAPFTLTIHLDPRLRFQKAPEFCTHDPAASRLVCTGTEPVSFPIETLSSDEGTGQPFVSRAELRTDDPSEVTENLNAMEAVTDTPLLFVVTNTADAGPGSLRDVIESVNARCNEKTSRCEIAFAIDGLTRWHTIQPLSPLPRVTATAILIDGMTQLLAKGDTNPEGLEIEIDGSLAGEGDGLVLDVPCSVDVRGLAINSFRGAGLAVRATRRCPTFIETQRIAGNFLGTDATGSVAMPNERGLVIESGSRWLIHGNVVSGNRRSGMFLWFAPNSRVFRNRIGLRAQEDLPLGNGGSGIFVGPSAHGTDLDDNYVTFNRETGIAVAAQWVRIGPNSIHANGLLGIDIGLDGQGGGVTAPPQITSAIFDPATGVTTIEGIGTRAGSFGPDDVQIYANDACDSSGRGEGQYTLGRATYPSFQNTRFRFTYSGDLTGRFITATSTARQCIGCFTTDAVEGNGEEFNVFTSTTEFSDCVAVTHASAGGS
jgi:Right handed beta helix region